MEEVWGSVWIYAWNENTKWFVPLRMRPEYNYVKDESNCLEAKKMNNIVVG